MLYACLVYHGFDDMPGRSGIRGGTAGWEFVPEGRLQHINTKYNDYLIQKQVPSTARDALERHSTVAQPQSLHGRQPASSGCKTSEFT